MDHQHVTNIDSFPKRSKNVSAAVGATCQMGYCYAHFF